MVNARWWDIGGILMFCTRNGRVGGWREGGEFRS